MKVLCSPPQSLIAAACALLLTVGATKAGQAQMYDFTVSMPSLSANPLSGSLQLNTDNLKLSYVGGTVAEWQDSVDVLNFNGRIYTGFSMVVHNDDYGQDGFTISSSDLHIDAVSDNNIIPDNTLSDLLTVLNSFDMIKAGSNSYRVVSNGGYSGSLISFEPVSVVPEPSTWAMLGMGLPALLMGAMRLRKREA